MNYAGLRLKSRAPSLEGGGYDVFLVKKAILLNFEEALTSHYYDDILRLKNSNIFRKYFPILSDMAFLHSWAQLLGIVEFSNFLLYQQCIFKIVQII